MEILLLMHTVCVSISTRFAVRELRTTKVKLTNANDVKVKNIFKCHILADSLYVFYLSKFDILNSKKNDFYFVSAEFVLLC